MIEFVLFEALLLSTLAYAAIRGGWAERSAGAILAICYSASSLAVASFDANMRTFGWPLFLIDLATLGALYIVAMRSEKPWLLWMSSMQGVTVLSHLAPLTHLINGWTYALFNQLWSYPQLVVLALGTGWHQLEVKKRTALTSRHS